MAPDLTPASLTAAIAIGLLIGVVRERHHPAGEAAAAGIRTHTLAAIVAAVAAGFGTAVLVASVLMIGALAMSSYRRTRTGDPGLTGEVSLLASALLAALAQHDPILAGGLGVITATVAYAKQPLQRFARDRLDERELQDGLLLAAAALVVLPMLPDTPIDPWGVLVPSRLWRLVVLMMAAGMAGHVALRLVGARWGLPLAGFLSGFASSTAAVASYGQRARETPALVGACASAALLANLASLMLLMGIVAAGSVALMRASAWFVVAAGVALALAAARGIVGAGPAEAPPATATARAFRMSHALTLAGVIALLLLVSAWLGARFGDAGALAAALFAALGEVHAAAATVTQLAAAGDLSMPQARWGLVGVLAAGAVAKSAIALASGGPAYAWRIAAGLGAMLLAAAGTLRLAG